LVEHLTFNQVVPGSSPGALTMSFSILSISFERAMRPHRATIVCGDQRRNVTMAGALSQRPPNWTA
jgi:hypothetical protein